MLLGSSHVGFLNRDNGQTAIPHWLIGVRIMHLVQRTEKYLGFCPTKKAGCSYTYISIKYRLRGSNDYLNRLMEDQKEFD